MRPAPALAMAALVACSGPAMACGLGLVLALDVSASVDAVEYRLQAEGLATALLSPEVSHLILNAPDPVALAAMTWSGPEHQVLIAPWLLIRGQRDLQGFAAQVAAMERPATFDGRTAIGAALLHSAAMFATAPDCARRTIDISVDGQNNAGPRPQTLRNDRVMEGITVNALAVGGDVAADRSAVESGPLAAYLRAYVIRGADAFVEVAQDYRDYSRAMQRKLLRELEVRMFSELRP